MSSSQSEQWDDAVSLERIRQLAALMEEHDLAELDVRQKGQRIHLRRGAVPQPVTPISPSASGPPTAGSQDAAGETTPDDKEGSSENYAVIRSPMVGTFYCRPNPDADPYVRVGDHVGPETIVCIIEAMKVFNEIPAEIAGRVVAVLVENEEPIDFGKPLFKVDTSG